MQARYFRQDVREVSVMAESAGLIAVLLWLASLVSALLVPLVKWLIWEGEI